MPETRDWQRMKDLAARLLQERTGQDAAHWLARIRRQPPADEPALRRWLAQQGVTGYAQSLLVMETFGYPEFMLASAGALVDGQYADRPALRPIYEAIIAAVAGLGEVVIQARKTYVSLVTPRRTFARVQATTRSRVDLALRLEGEKPGGRLAPSRIHETTPLQVSLFAPEDVDAQVLGWLEKAYAQNA